MIMIHDCMNECLCDRAMKDTEQLSWNRLMIWAIGRSMFYEHEGFITHIDALSLLFGLHIRAILYSNG